MPAEPSSRSTSPKHIVLVVTDQQRWDSLGCVGASWAKTPNLDALARRGAAVRRGYAQSTVCGPSRASIVSAQYVHHHGAGDNGQWLAPDAPNWIERLRDAGWRTVNVGKMHTVPVHQPCGFEQRWVCENKNHQSGTHGEADDYDRLLAERGIAERPGVFYRDHDPDWADKLNATIWPLDDDLYPDNVVGRRSVEAIEGHDFAARPLFLWSGFAGPHDPFDVPAEALAAYGSPPLPPVNAAPNEMASKPASQRAYMEMLAGLPITAAIDWNRATPQRIDQVRRCYHANVMLIDRWVGRIVEALDRKGVLDETLIVFTSDHGEALWDHHLVYKFASHYDPVVGVPLLCAGPGVAALGAIDPLVELIDLGPTLLDFAGLEPTEGVDGRSFRPVLDATRAAHRDAVFSAYENRDMVRTRRWKLVRYLDGGIGELYDLEADPGELFNRWAEEAGEAAEARASLLARLAAWRAG